jgi:hypothetical protein
MIIEEEHNNNLVQLVLGQWLLEPALGLFPKGA